MPASGPPSRFPWIGNPWPGLLGIALAWTVLDAIKPLHIDDAAYYYFAAQIAQHPLDPYGFVIFWRQEPQPANRVLAPPVLPYWWAAGIRLFGDHPWSWKLWMFPWALLFAASLWGLFRRFAGGLEWPLLGLVVLSPAFLPSLNLMLDIPALGLSLAATLVFFRATDQSSLRLAAAAGLLAGLAMQTKYTGAMAVAVMLVYATLSRRVRLGLVAVGIAAVIFLAWEDFTAVRYGQSHFLANFGRAAGSTWTMARMIWPFVVILGGVSPAVIMLGLLALGQKSWMISVVAAVPILGFVMLATSPDPGASKSLPSDWVFGSLGLTLVVVTCLIFRRLWQASRKPGKKGAMVIDSAERRTWWLLVVWLGLEVAAALLMSPFPAVRRLCGVILLITLLVGRLAARICSNSNCRRPLLGTCAFGALLGTFYAVIDWREASAQQEVAERAAGWVRNQDPEARVWYVGHWGFQYYAERAGMMPIVPRLPANAVRKSAAPVSILQKGDWLVLPDTLINQQRIYMDPAHVEERTSLEQEDPLPFRTVPTFYVGTRALDRLTNPRRSVRIFRITADTIAVSPF